MKKLKFTGLIVLVLVMTLMLVTTAMADDPEIGSITLHKFGVTSQVPFKNEGDGTQLALDDEIASGVKLQDLEPMVGVKFVLTQVELIEGAEKGSNNVSDYQPVQGFDPIEEMTDVNGEILWDELDFGFYLVEELETALSDTITTPFIVQLPMTNPAGNGFFNDVHVYPKNVFAGPEIDKEPVELDPDSGSHTIRWKISIDIPADIKDAERLVIIDELDLRLSYLMGTMEASYITKAGEVFEFKSEFYSASISTGGGNETVTITIKGDEENNGFAELNKALTEEGDVAPKVVFEFDTYIRISKPEDLGTIENDAELEYTNSGGYEYDPKTPPEPAEVDVYAIKIVKTDDEENPLPGAQFLVYPTYEDALAETNPIWIYYISGFFGEEDFETLDAPFSGTPRRVTTYEEGIGFIYGLQAGTYWLVEVQAPDGGYNLIREPIEVIVSADTAEDFIVTVEVINRKGFLLPTTGGMGTQLFTIGGLSLIGLAAVTAIITILRGEKKRKSSEVLGRRFR